MSLKGWSFLGRIKRYIQNLSSYLMTKRLFFPLGHFHSTIPSSGDFKFEFQGNNYCEIDLNESSQFELLQELSKFYSEVPFCVKQKTDANYFYENRYFSYSDAIILFCILSHFKPNEIIEIGAGFSTACMLDTLSFTKQKTRIECYTINSETPSSLTRYCPDNVNLDINYLDVRNVPLSVFERLGVGDILFIDSSHVSKYHSDLNHIVFNILPLINSQVIIHFHDIFKNFEYPKAWIEEGIYWNEQYLLRAFLQNNSNYEILYFSDYMEDKYQSWFELNMPHCLEPHEKYSVGSKKGELIKDLRGQSLWLRKK